MQLVQWLKLLREDGSVSEEQRTHLSIQLLEVLQNSTTALDSLLVSQPLLVSQSIHISTCILPDDSLDTRDWNYTSIFSYNTVIVLNLLQNLLTGENVNSGDIEAILSGFEHLASQVHMSRANVILRAINSETDVHRWVAA